MEYLYSFTVALFLTIALIPLFIRFSARLGLVDAPIAERKIHEHVMPRTGGLAIICGVFIPLFYLMSQQNEYISLLLGCVIIIGFGLWDDRVELNFVWKLFGQSLAAIVVMSNGVVVHQLPFMGLMDAPVWLYTLSTFFFLVGVVNGVNFSDGLDGLAAGTSIMGLLLILALALLSDNVEIALISITLVGGVLGFLRYNTFPARIFMGDAGSQFLGFAIACLAIIVTQDESAPFSTLLPVLILGIPIMDILQVVPVRVHKKLPLPGPDQEHFHHQLVKLGFRHYEVVAIIYVLQAVLLVGALWLCYQSDFLVALYYGLFVTLVLGAILFGSSVGWQFRARQRRGEVKERRNKLLRRFAALYTYAARGVAFYLCLFFVLIGGLLRTTSGGLASTALLMAGLAVVFILVNLRHLTVAYRIVLYTSCILFAYLVVLGGLEDEYEYWVNGLLIGLLALLILTFRVTRKDDFSLNTQDLLILLVVIIIPLSPFEALDRFSVGRFALTLAVLLYASEYLLTRGVRTVTITVVGAIIGLLLFGVSGTQSLI